MHSKFEGHDIKEFSMVDAHAISLKDVWYTCPVVHFLGEQAVNQILMSLNDTTLNLEDVIRGEIDSMTENLKDQVTHPFRDALVDAICDHASEIERYEERIAKLEAELKKLKANQEAVG